MTKDFWKAALIRAGRTVAQSLLASIPAGVVVSVKDIGIDTLWVVLSWLATGIVAGGVSILTSIATGLPETDVRIEYRYMDENGVPVDGHYALIHNIEEDVNETEAEDDE